MRDFPRSERFASIVRSCVLSASSGMRRRIRTITKMGVSRFEYYEFVDVFQPRGSAHFFTWLSYACAYRRKQKNVTTHNGSEPFAPGEVAHRFSLP